MRREKKSTKKNMGTKMKINRPTKYGVDKCLGFWRNEANFYKPEEALTRLFGDYRLNSDISAILAKVYAINDAFGTAVYWQIIIAEHIERQNIDEGLSVGDLFVVDRIRLGHGIKTSKGRERNLYSFATKYCAFHNPEKYPMFDSNVERALRYFNKHHEFKFDGDLRKYKDFVSTIEKFQKTFELQSFSFRDIDKYLYLIGRELNPPKS